LQTHAVDSEATGAFGGRRSAVGEQEEVEIAAGGALHPRVISEKRATTPPPGACTQLLMASVCRTLEPGVRTCRNRRDTVSHSSVPAPAGR